MEILHKCKHPYHAMHCKTTIRQQLNFVGESFKDDNYSCHKKIEAYISESEGEIVKTPESEYTTNFNTDTFQFQEV